MADQAVVLSGYDPGWPDRFAEQREQVEELLRPWLARPVEHVGSTSVPGLRAKPVVDMLAPVVDLVFAQDAVPVLAEAGWLFWPRIRAVTTGCGFCGQGRRRARITCT